MTPTPETEALRVRVLALRAALIAHELRAAIEQYVTNPTPIGWIEAEQVAIRLKRTADVMQGETT